MRRCAVAILLAALVGQGFASISENEDPISAEEAVRRLQQKYDDIHSFSADFRQIHRSRGIVREERGRVLMSRPGRMHWEYTEPYEKLFVSDGRQTYFYVPRDRQVMVADLDLEGGGTPLLFLMGEGRIDEGFQVKLEGQEEPERPGNLLLRLTPLEPQGEFLHILLEVDPETFLIHRLSVVEPIGSRNDYLLENFQSDVRIPDSQFEFRIPSGVEVIR